MARKPLQPVDSEILEPFFHSVQKSARGRLRAAALGACRAKGRPRQNSERDSPKNLEPASKALKYRTVKSGRGPYARTGGAAQRAGAAGAAGAHRPMCARKARSTRWRENPFSFGLGAVDS